MRRLVFFRKKPPLIPDPGQRVRLRTGRGPWRGSFRAVSEPYTDEERGVMIRVAQEREYRSAIREGRRAVGMPWPAQQIAVAAPLEETDERTRDLPTASRRAAEEQERAESRPAAGGAQEGTENRPRNTAEFPVRGGLLRPWWRRVFGG